jgi:hypothetical protein
MKDNILPSYPEVIVNIKSIEGLDYIKIENNSIKIGSMTRLDDVANNDLVKQKCGMLAEAAKSTASPHIREMGTVGGNICQNNRCWYYWVPDNRFNCLRKGGKTCYALVGDGRYHSIFGVNRVGSTPCITGCPNNTDIPGYLSKIRNGEMEEAVRVFLEYNPLPAITGRVCPHFCESECNRGEFDEPVSVRNIERYLGDYIIEHSSDIYKSPKPRPVNRLR